MHLSSDTIVGAAEIENELGLEDSKKHSVNGLGPLFYAINGCIFDTGRRGLGVTSEPRD